MIDTDCVRLWQSIPAKRQQAIIDAVGDLAIGSQQEAPDALVAEHCLALLAHVDADAVVGALRIERVTCKLCGKTQEEHGHPRHRFTA